MVSAAGMKAKLTGLMVEKQELRVTDGDFNETMTSREILQKVAAKRGMQAAWYMATAFGLDPAEHGISFNGEPAARVASTPPTPTLEAQ